MKLHTVFITHNRLECTKRAIESYLETVTVPYTVSIIDNGSTDGTEDWFFDTFNDEPVCFTALGENKYPGYATNLGWAFGVQMNPDYTHLQRADNDFAFLSNWCDAVEAAFSDQGRRHVGQVGLRTGEEERHNGMNVGGNNVILRELWDAGLRYDERPWPEIWKAHGNGMTEDSLLSPKVRKMGYVWTRVQTPCIQPISVEDPTDPYYLKTWEDRGLLDWALDAYGIKR